MTDDIRGMFEALGQRTEDLANGRTTAGSIPVISAEATSEDEQITVKVTGGKLTDCLIDVRAMRLSNAELGSKIVEATNKAMEKYAEEALAAWQGQGTEFAGMQEQLKSIGEQAQKSMENYMAGMKQALDQVSERANRP